MAISLPRFLRVCLDAAAHYERQAQAATDAQDLSEAQGWQEAAAQAQDSAAICRLVENDARKRALLLLREAGLHPFAQALDTGDVAHCLDLPR